MNFKPNPLLYGANEDFFSSFKLAITMRYCVEHETLCRAVAKAMKRYPYFSVYPEKCGNSIILTHNERPVPVFNDGRCVVLGTEESCGHLLAFGCEEKKIFLHASHYIADGMGIDPLLKTVLYLYVSELYGADGLSCDRINMPSDPVMKEEYEYPFFDKPVEIDSLLPMKKTSCVPYSLNPNEFDSEGLYAYHLHIPQKAMMAKANPSDGSPVSFLSVMLYRALCLLDDGIDQPIVGHVQHQYRSALKAPVNRHSLVSYIPVTLSAKAKEWHVERQNTVIRGQVILGSEKEADLNAVNRLLTVFPDGDETSLEEKERLMRQYVEDSIRGKTFGISYVGKMDWCGLDKYVEDLHAYIGEKNTKDMLLIEVMTIGEDFTINFMQSGKGDLYVNAFAEQLRSFDIPVDILGGERYTLCDTKIPVRQRRINNKEENVYRKVYIEITNICNMSCSFCHGHKREKRQMSINEFTLVLDKLKGQTEYIYYHLMGEPLTHPLLPEFIKTAGKRGFKSIITTNGTLLNKRKKELLKAGLHKVNISLHSFENGTEDAHKRYVYELAEFAKAAAEQGTIVVFRLWNKGCDDGKNDISLQLLKENISGEWKENTRGVKIRDKIYLEWGERFEWPDINADIKGDKFFCYGLKDQFGILCDGTVVPCCLDSDGVIHLGNIFTDDITAILNSKRAVNMVESFKCGKASEELCRRCGYAQRFV